MTTSRKARILVLTLIGLTPLLSVPALAANTAAGTTISNLATVNYTVGGVAQPAIGSSPTGNPSGGGTPTTFLVDNKVDLSVLETDGKAANTSPGLTTTGIGNAVAVFKLTNLGNNPQGYTLAVTQPVGGTVFSPDTFDMTNVKAVVSAAPCTFGTTTTPTYVAATDTATSVPSLTASPATGSCVYVIVLGDTPNGLPNGAAATVRLTATTVTAGTLAPIAPTAGPDNPAAVDIVFADQATVASGAHPAQIAGDGKAFDDDQYLVVAPSLTVTKTSLVISDPINLTTNPKAIPGATLQYTITVANAAAGAPAAAVTIGDPIPANTTFVSGSITLNGAGITDAAGFSAGSVTVNAGALAPSATDTLIFKVTIN